MTVDDSVNDTAASNNDTFHEEEEDDGAWIPLTPTETDSGRAESSSSRKPKNSPLQCPSVGTQAAGNARLMQLQRRLETRTSLRRNLIDHPIDLFWKRYLVNLAREIWQLDIHIRLGLSMVLVGVTLKVFMLSTWYIWYPRTALVTALLVGWLIAYDPFGIKNEFQRVGSIFSPDGAAQAIERLDMKQLRRLSLCLFLIPTALEVRTLSFLAQTSASSGSAFLNFLLSAILFATMIYLLRAKHEKPRECMYRGMLLLYGYAFIKVLIRNDLRRAPALGAPFLTSTGTLLLAYRDDDMEWISRMLRHALRLTLRDVLSSMSNKVTEDEMLQLAVLRWIADYWSSTTDPPTNSSASPPEQDSAPVPPTENTPTSTETTVPSPETAPSVPEDSTQSPTEIVVSNTPRRSSRRQRFRTHEVQWNELLPMLDVAAEHMTLEAQTLNSGTSNTRASNPQPSAAGSASRENSGDPFAGLRQMLMSLDVDERGKPAVLSYRRAIESFPPDRSTAFTISLLRKCPALLTLLLHMLIARRSLFGVAMFIVPFVVLEYFRVRSWQMGCREMAPTTPANLDSDESSMGVSSAVGHADAMVILLCGDASSFVRPPTLLLVWRNIESSVSALEVGLTAARCAQTGIVAAEFAGNVMSLLQLGYDVHQYGLWHGVAVVAKEFLMHPTGNTQHEDTMMYTNAAVGALENAKRVSRNVQTLSEDENLDPVVRPLVWTLRVLTGHGWLWGNNQTNDDDATRVERPSSENEPAPDLVNINSQGSQPEREELKVSDIANKEGATSPQVGTSSTPNKQSDKEDELAEVMGMVATAYEQGLINENEKDDFCEKLSKLTKNEIYDAPLIKGMKQSLQIVLDNEDHQDWQAAKNSSNETMETALRLVTTAFEEGLITESEKQSYCSKIAASSRDEVSQKTLEAMVRSLEGVLQESNDVSSQSAATGSPKAEASDATVNRERTEGCLPSEDNTRTMTLTLCKESEQGGDVANVTSSQTVKLGHKNPTSSSVGSQQESEENQQQATTEEQEEGKEAWIKFGVAALGVVAGSLLLSMAGNDGNEDQGGNTGRRSTEGNDGPHQANTSAVVIEELSEDEDDDWVSVPTTGE